MPHISVEIDEESDALIQKLATKERRSKREQFAFSAIAHARSQLPDFTLPTTEIKNLLKRHEAKAKKQVPAAK